MGVQFTVCTVVNQHSEVIQYTSASVKVVEGQRHSICVLKGSSVDLPCSAQRAASNVSWYTVHTNGSIYPTYSMTEEVNFTLTIKDVRESDAKLYCCKESTANPDFCSHNQTELLLTGTAAAFQSFITTALISVYVHSFYSPSFQSCR